MDDKNIIDLFFERSENAIKELEGKYGRLIMSLSRNILNNPSDAEECVNDTYLGVWNSIPPERPDSLTAYVCRIARNLSLKKYQYNTAAKRNSHMDTALEELENTLADSGNVEQEVIQAELAREIERFMDSLKQTDRVVFMRRYYFADSYEAIAEITGISAKNVSVKLARVRGRLKEYLKDRGLM
ncbi:MAG: sigma-70 family RNA polymerase sigma factor [Parasporobacterium sp.]|nr:sigma-70 family RNA polymerase sigma factor [Parasporobacterium sp.]